jgi:SAM-dependent methyltransferase
MTDTPSPSSLARPLLDRFLRLYPFQPATAFFRSVEVAWVISEGLPEGRGLDLGCGDGKLTGVLFEHLGGRPLVGIDPDPTETELARESGLYEEVHTVPGDSVPADDNEFDFALSNSTLEHIPDLGPVLEETARVLKPGGRFMFTVPSESFHDCLRGPLGSGDRARYLRELDERNAHLRYWSPDRWREELAERGLTVSTTRRYLTREEMRRWESLHRATSGVLSRVFGNRRRPIEIQSTLGVRSQRRPLPGAVAAPLGRALAAGLDLGRPPGTGEPSGCVLVVARKDGAGPGSA